MAAILLCTRHCAGLYDHRVRHRVLRLLVDIRGKGSQCILLAIEVMFHFVVTFHIARDVIFGGNVLLCGIVLCCGEFSLRRDVPY